MVYKVPKPKVFKGDGLERDPDVIDGWIRSIKDYMRLSEVPEGEKMTVV